MDWYKPCAYDGEQKRRFHATVRSRLRRLTAVLGLTPATHSIRSCQGGMAVSGEVILHTDHFYIQVSQPATGHDSGILIRTCRGRKDLVGGPNTYAPLSMLDDVAALAAHVQRITAMRAAA